MRWGFLIRNFSVVFFFTLFSITGQCQQRANLSAEKPDSLTLRRADYTTSYSLELMFLTKYQDLLQNPVAGYFPELPYYRSTSRRLSISELIAENKSEFLRQSGDFYFRTKPTPFQKFMGMVNFAGAVGLAGYHVYKYYIKKDESKKNVK